MWPISTPELPVTTGSSWAFNLPKAVLLVAFGMPETRSTSTEAAGEADLEAVARRDSCRGKSR